MKIATFVAAAGAAGLLAACADYYGPNGYGYGYGYGDYYGPVAAVGYDGFYDDYYGPFFDGYWGTDGFFYYRGGDNDRWHRDAGQHFSHQARNGFHPIEGHAHVAPARENRPG